MNISHVSLEIKARLKTGIHSLKENIYVAMVPYPANAKYHWEREGEAEDSLQTNIL